VVMVTVDLVIFV